MDTNSLVVSTGLLICGVILIIVGVLRKLGKVRNWYLTPNYYVLLPKGAGYALPVSGLICISFGVVILVNNPVIGRQILYWVIVPLLILNLSIVVFQPDWLKPKWVRWLEENHGDILEILIREGRETPNWGEKVSTQEGLEEWVEEVRRKRGLKRKRERR